MNRRDFLRSTGIVFAGALFAEQGWRTFEVVTRVEVAKPAGVTRVWVPAPNVRDTSFQKILSNQFQAEGGTARLGQPGMVSAEFAAGVPPVLTVTSRVATKDFSVDLAKRGNARPMDPEARREYLQPTKLMPTDGIVRTKSLAITQDAGTDLEKARAIYNWIVENTFRNPKTRGCGRGDIRFMLESGDLGGKCADLNALYVGLARAAGLPARDAYGIRLAKSELGYKSLGTASANVTKAQHCRAEVYVGGYGWIPVDPADVKKVALEEPPGNRPLSDATVERARTRLFGSWEMNWMAYNFATDVALPGSSGKPVPFFMYPQAETGGERLDSLDPDTFRYEITSKEIATS